MNVNYWLSVIIVNVIYGYIVIRIIKRYFLGDDGCHGETKKWLDGEK